MTSEAKFLPHFALLMQGTMRTIDVFAFISSQDYFFLSGLRKIGKKLWRYIVE